MKKILILATLILLLCGCESYKELDRMEIVAGLYMDTAETNILRLTAETVSFDKGEEQPRVYVAEGVGIRECLTRMMEQCSNELYLSHMEVIVLSREFATNRLSELTEHILRDNSIRLATAIVIAKDGQAGQLVVDNDGKEIISYNLSNLLENSKNTGRSIHKEGYIAIRQLLDVGNTTTLPVVEGDSNSLKTAGCVVVGEKGMLFLDEEETMLLNILSNDFTKGSIGVDFLGEPLAVSIKECKTDICTDTSEIATVQYKAKTEFELETARKLQDDEAENMVRKHLCDGAYRLYDRLREYDLDALGVIRLLKAQHPETFRVIGENGFQNSQLVFDVNMRVGEAIT